MSNHPVRTLGPCVATWVDRYDPKVQQRPTALLVPAPRGYIVRTAAATLVDAFEFDAELAADEVIDDDDILEVSDAPMIAIEDAVVESGVLRVATPRSTPPPLPEAARLRRAI